MEGAKKPLDRFFEALFGDGEKAREEAENYRKKVQERVHETIQNAEKIMAENHLSSKDIPASVYVDVALRNLENHAYSFTLAIPAYRDINSSSTGEDFMLTDIAEELILSKDLYDLICRSAKAEDIMGDEQKASVKALLEEADKILKQSGRKPYTKGIVKTVAYGIVHNEVKRLREKENPSGEDAMAVNVACRLRLFVLDEYAPFNVPLLEERMKDLKKHSLYRKIDGVPEKAQLLMIPPCARENRELYEKATDEIERLLNHTEECFGYRLNCIKSGENRYDVFRWKYEEVESNPDDDETPQMYNMYAEDLGEYDTLDEAKQAFEGDEEPAEVVEYDPNEYWVIVDRDGKNPTGMFYPHEIRAAVFLANILGRTNLPNWYAWNNYADSFSSEEE